MATLIGDPVVNPPTAALEGQRNLVHGLTRAISFHGLATEAGVRFIEVLRHDHPPFDGR